MIFGLGYIGPFLRHLTHAKAHDELSPALEVITGSFELIPSWSKNNKKIVRHTYSARSETVGEKPSFRGPWRHAQHYIIPTMVIYKPDWRIGKAIAKRITRADGELMGITGLWECWHDSSSDQILHSYTMLTVNAGL